jgi:hypothetical protein
MFLEDEEELEMGLDESEILEEGPLKDGRKKKRK